MLFVITGLIIINSLYLSKSFELNLSNDLSSFGDTDNSQILEEALLRLDLLLKFFENNYLYINLDGLFGIRIAQGKFYEILSSGLSDIDEIQSTHDRLSNLSSKAYESIKIKTPEYLMTFDSLARSQIILNNIETTINILPINFSNNYPIKRMIKPENIPSDECISSLLNENCNIKDKCIKFITNQNASGNNLDLVKFYI